ncbi:MAG: hypothetical protein ACTHMB_14645 [Candidatus Binatia bacterium]
MDRLENEEIGLIWARHYPKRTESETSKSLCVTLFLILKKRAEVVPDYSKWADKLQHVLTSAQIPKDQFETVENDVKTDPRLFG